MDERKDLLGNALTDDERELIDLYRKLHALSRRDDLPPSASANLKHAMVHLWNACNDLCLLCEEPGCD